MVNWSISMQSLSSLKSVASMLAAIATIALCLWLGHVLQHRFQLPLPGALLGMMLLLLGLLWLPEVPQGMQKVSAFLLRNMSLWLIPPVVGVLAHLELLQKNWLALLLAGVLGTALTLIVTAWVFKTMLRRQPAHRTATGMAESTDHKDAP